MSLNENRPANCPVCEAIICPVCNGKGWYASGATDKPDQVQCPDCLGTGLASEAGSVPDGSESDNATRASSENVSTPVPSLTELLDEIDTEMDAAMEPSDWYLVALKVPALVKALRFATDEFTRMANEEIERVAKDANFANRKIAQLLTPYGRTE